MPTIKQAISLARANVGAIRRTGQQSYVFHSPFYPEQPNGPSHEIRRSTYPAARIARNGELLRVALAALLPEMMHTDDGRNAIMHAVMDYQYELERPDPYARQSWDAAMRKIYTELKAGE